MTHPKTDPRIKRTLSSLKRGLYDLMKTKEISKISVTELCATSGVTRQTFYLHFNDLDGLIQIVSEEVLDSFQESFQGYVFEFTENLMEISSHENFLRIFQHIQENKTTYESLLVKNPTSPFALGFKEELKKFITESINIAVMKDNFLKFPKEFTIIYTTAAYLEVIIWWIENNYHYSIEEMGSMLLQISLKGAFQV